jgi:acetyl-CoA synthase
VSKIIASAAIRGAHKIVERAEKEYQEALSKWGPDQEVGFPDTAYYLPVIYSILGIPVKKIRDMKQILDQCRTLLPPPVREKVALPYLAPALDAGMATFFAEEIIEAIRYLEAPNFYTKQEDVLPENIWLGAANDAIFRKRGVEFVDGTAPGFAAIVGAAPSPEIAKKIATELQEKNLYVFMCAEHEGKRFSEQLVEADVQIGWPTRLVSYGPDITAAVFAMGFACRVAMSFGGVKPGDFRRNLLYNKDRTFAFVMPMGFVSDEWYANAAGAINWGFPTIADTPIPEILPTGICTYEHVVSNIPHEQIVQKAIEVRGLKINVTSVPIPVPYGPAFEGERVRGEDIYMECGGGRTPAVEYVTSKRLDEVEDGKVEVIGPELDSIQQTPGKLPLGIQVEVAGRQMQDDFEPILERQIHHLINYAQGVMHIGQRDIAWIRVAKGAVAKGFKLEHIGKLLHAKLHQDFGVIFDKVQVKIFTKEKEVEEMLARARNAYAKRDARIEGMTDETTDPFYSCTLCQSFAPNHVCIVSPERTGLCGAYNWMDCKAAYEIDPTGPNQPVPKGEILDADLGQWEGTNKFAWSTSHNTIPRVSMYSMMNDPMTTCGCCECIASVLPQCNGFMTVNRDFMGMTPCGMKFSTLAGAVGGGTQTPGFLGHSKYNIIQRKWLTADGGLARLVWIPKILKEELHERLKLRGEEIGVPDFIDRIADETIGVTEDEILPFLQEKQHPALTMKSVLEL